MELFSNVTLHSVLFDDDVKKESNLDMKSSFANKICSTVAPWSISSDDIPNLIKDSRFYAVALRRSVWKCNSS